MANSRKDYQRAWYLANLGKAKAARHNYYLRNKERIIFRSLENHRRNREHYNELSRERRKKNPEALRRAYRKWAASHREQELERGRIKGRERYQKHRERLLAENKAWRTKHPEVIRANSQKRRAKKRAVSIKPERIAEWMQRMRSRRSAVCHYCGKRISSKIIHFDHIKALAKGGEHRIENLCVSCPKCNLTKGTAALNEWCKQGQQMLALFT